MPKNKKIVNIKKRTLSGMTRCMVCDDLFKNQSGRWIRSAILNIKICNKCFGTQRAKDMFEEFLNSYEKKD